MTPWMLRRCSSEAKLALLAMCNASWERAEIPEAWRLATIVPLLKTGKTPAEIGSYRPVSLTSCLCKTAERLVQRRLQHWSEANGIFDPAQAGFRANRSTEEQVARVAQFAMDGFNARPRMERTLVVLVDFSRAYDRVWKRGLLFKMRKNGVPGCIQRWVANFFADRRARVQWGDTFSRTKVLKEGLPQGCVLSPLLWLLYMDDVKDALAVVPETLGSKYADDLALVIRGNHREELAERMQLALNALEEWCEQWSVKISVEKTVALLLSTDPADNNGKYDPHLSINGKAIQVEKEPVFLGVTLDSQLGFGAHAKKVQANIARRTNLLRRLKGKKWGCRPKLLLHAHSAYIQPVARYGASSWAVMASKSVVDNVQASLNVGLRVATGCSSDTNRQVLLAEAGAIPLDIQAKAAAALLYEKALRLPSDVPIHQVALQTVERRIRYGGGGKKAAVRQGPPDPPAVAPAPSMPPMP